MGCLLEAIFSSLSWEVFPAWLFASSETADENSSQDRFQFYVIAHTIFASFCQFKASHWLICTQEGDKGHGSHPGVFTLNPGKRGNFVNPRDNHQRFEPKEGEEWNGSDLERLRLGTWMKQAPVWGTGNWETVREGPDMEAGVSIGHGKQKTDHTMRPSPPSWEGGALTKHNLGLGKWSIPQLLKPFSEGLWLEHLKFTLTLPMFKCLNGDGNAKL